jgi:lysozyme
MKTSDAGIELIKGFEGLRLTAYRDAAGVATIGYGHAGQDVQESDTITEAEADRLLRLDLLAAELAVQKLVKAPLNQHQFDALVSFVFNLGAENLKSSTLLRLLNDGLYAHAAQQFNLWVHAKGQRLTGLVRRRAAERALFESADGNTDAGGPAPATAAAGASEPAAPPAPQPEPQPVGWDSLQGVSHHPTPEQPPAPVEDRRLPSYTEPPARKEPAMPAAAALAFIKPALAVLAPLVPEIIRLFGTDGSRITERNAKAAEAVARIAVEATGARNIQEAAELVSGDVDARNAVVEQVRARWYEIAEAGGGGIKGARGFAAQMMADQDWRAMGYGTLIAALALGVVIGGGAMVWGLLAAESTTAEQRGMLIGALVATISAVVSYFFGSSASSRQKDATLASELARK